MCSYVFFYCPYYFDKNKYIKNAFIKNIEPKLNQFLLTEFFLG